MVQNVIVARATETPLQTILRRVAGVFRLKQSIFKEIEADPHGMRQAAVVVAVVSAAAVLATFLYVGWHAGEIAGAIAAALLHWLLWSALVQLAAIVIFRAPVRMAAVLRGLGYAQAPQILIVLAVIPVLGPVAVFIARLLTMFAGNLANQEALGVKRWRVIVATFVTFVITWAIASAVRVALGDIAFVDAVIHP